MENTKKKAPRYSPEVRERAVRMVLEHQGDRDSQWKVIGLCRVKDDGVASTAAEQYFRVDGCRSWAFATVEPADGSRMRVTVRRESGESNSCRRQEEKSCFWVVNLTGW
ncbi:hypothetical protein AB4Y45_43985 [Paraburkholderia sp. EG287A]|uniref:hypothetical protein n=1 Tax=unclassified Paraburkholderia TaxID=2615204 RepID=UPI0034D2B9FC